MAQRRALLWLLMFALLAAQTLGFVHRVLHAPQGQAYVQGIEVSKTSASLASLFAGHEDDSTCRLYDQLGHGDAAPCVPQVILPLAIPAFLFEYFQGDFVARWAALFDARGPPSVR